MLPVSFLAIIFTLSLSVFLNTSFHSFKNYNHQLKDLTNWQETGLAAAKRVSIESSNFVFDLQSQLNTCLEEYSTLENQNQRDTFACDVDYQNIVSDFQNSLKANYSNQLNNTIKFGLNPDSGVKTYENYSYELYHSDRLPSAVEKGDDLYNSTIVSEADLGSLVDINDAVYFLDGYKLNLDAELLESLVGKENSDLISSMPSKFNLNLNSNDKLSEDKLPNAIKVSVHFHKRLNQANDDSSEDDSSLRGDNDTSLGGDKDSSLRGEGDSSLRGVDEAISTKELLSAAQLRLRSAVVAVGPTVVCNVCDCPGYPACPTNTGGGDTSSSVAVNRQTIQFSLFDSINGRGILFDNSQPASAQNKINIVNTNQGRFTSVYPGSGNYLQIDIGTMQTGSSVLSSNVRAAQNTIDPTSVQFGTVTFEERVGSGSTIVNGTHQKINVDIVPRARKRYMTAQRDFVVNGKTIPQGSVLVGTLEPGSSETNPQLKDFSTIRVYDQNTGALMQIFKPSERPGYCSGQSCMKVDQFTASGSNSAIGGSIHTSFSTSQLFSGKDAFRANDLFTKIQRDLELNTVTGIYAKNYDWQTDILKDDLNAEQQVLLTEIFENNNASTKAGQLAIAAYLGLSYVRTNDELYNIIQDQIIKTFVAFAEKKTNWFRDKNTFLNFSERIKFKNSVANAKDIFLKNRSVYQDLLKSRINRKQAITRVNNINQDLDIDEDSFIVNENSNSNNSTTMSNSKNTTTTTIKPPAPTPPNCMSKKPKNRSNKCKDNIKKYKADLEKYNQRYG
jgi:hypothetical protein